MSSLILNIDGSPEMLKLEQIIAHLIDKIFVRFKCSHDSTCLLSNPNVNLCNMIYNLHNKSV